jgi:thiol-disulfide isomerase/thioredoxin
MTMMKSTTFLLNIFLALLLFQVATFSLAIRLGISKDTRQLAPTSIHLQKETFHEEFSNLPPQSPCLVEFYAHWCPACRAFAPQYEHVAQFFNVAPRPEPEVTVFSVDCAEEQELCSKWKINGYPTVFFGSAIEFAGERAKDVKEVTWKENEKRTKTGAKQIVEFVGKLVIPSTEYDFSYPEDDSSTSKKDGASSSAPAKENENLARLAFQNDQKKGLDYKTVKMMASKDDLERATVEMWNQIVYDAEIASRELNALLSSSRKNSKTSASSIESNALGSDAYGEDITHSTPADKARGKVETVKNAIGSLIHAFSKTHPIAECRASFRGLLPGADGTEGEEEEIEDETSNISSNRDAGNDDAIEEELESADDPLLAMASKKGGKRRKTITIQHHLFWDDESNGLSKFAAKTFTPCGRAKAPEWNDCKPSSPNSGSRGYTCGVWMLLHATALRSKELDKHQGGHVWYDAFVNGFIRNFFNCLECREHFLKMAEETKGFEVETPEEIAFWIWRRHNDVNERLASEGDPAGDPKYPKQQWPDVQSCAKCRHTDGSWNDDNVLKFLQVYFLANEKPRPRSTQAKMVKVRTSSTSASRLSARKRRGRPALSVLANIFVILSVLAFIFFSVMFKDKISPVFERFKRKHMKRVFDDWP